MQLTKYLTRILNTELNHKGKSASGIAWVLARLVLREKLALGIELPTQVKLAAGLNVPVSVIQHTWALLLGEYGIIETKRGTGTHIISHLHENQKYRVAKLIKQFEAPAYKALFDREVLPGFSARFDSKVLRAFTLYNRLPVSEQNLKIIPGLLSALAKLISRKMKYKFLDNEVYYTDDYNELITFCCAAFSSVNSTILILSPASGVARMAMAKAKRRVRSVGSHCAKGLMIELEKLCNSLTVDIVYVGTTAPYPLLSDNDISVWEQLHALQLVYGFKILLDDRYPQVVNFPNLFERIRPETNTAVIFITTVSIHEKLHTVNVVAGHFADIHQLKSRYKAKGKQVHPSVGYGLLNLIQNGKLYENEVLALASLKLVAAAAKEILLASNLFVAAYIEKQQGSFFYLQLASGSYPNNVYRRHMGMDMFIMDPKIYRSGPPFNAGILISVANYTIKRQMEKDLSKLMENIKNIKK